MRSGPAIRRLALAFSYLSTSAMISDPAKSQSISPCPDATTPCSGKPADKSPEKPGSAAPGTAQSTTETVTVTAKRLQLLGTVLSASEGIIDDQELRLTPAYRPAQLLETVPGLIVTSHSGEGKANQYLLRGYNLDHGTDLETIIDGMPINQPTHAHGQGYTDLNFLIPELTDALRYTKGPYYANVGDFGGVGSVHMNIRDTIPDQMTGTVGTFGFERLLTAGSQSLGSGNLLTAVELQHYDGPFDVPDDARKVNLVMRYSDGGADQGFSLTGMFYRGLWTSSSDIPLRAISEGIVPDRFGSLDSSDGGSAIRASLSAQYHANLGEGQISASAFAIYNQLHLFNDFTHFLFDPIHGDQEDQFEYRRVIGASVNYGRPVMLGGLGNDLLIGAQSRYDFLGLGRLPAQGRTALSAMDTAGDPVSFSNDDRVGLYAGAAYAQVTTHWSPAFRSVVGVRADYQQGTDKDLLAALHESDGYTNAGSDGQALIQPKGSLIYSASDALEFYVSAGEGFHSADLRGVNQDRSVDLGLPNTPLLAKQYGEEIGVRSALRQDISATVTIYNLWQSSETIIDPDIGTDVAGPASERYGFEVNTTYQIRSWLELYASYTRNHARFSRPFDDGTGHLGKFITDAPIDAGTLAFYLKDLGPWSGGLEYRYLGNYPLSSGPCNDAAAAHDFPRMATSCADAPTPPGQVNGKGFGQLNLDVHYSMPSGWVTSLGLYNLTNTHAAAAEFFYVDRLKSEIASFPDGRADIHEHPLEPFMARISISKQFE